METIKASDLRKGNIDIIYIPLTEDILVNWCGAVLNNRSKILKVYWLHLKRNLYLTFSDVGTTNFTASIICMDENDIIDCNIIHNWDYDKDLHLHQLQNIYFALAGQELEVKPKIG